MTYTVIPQKSFMEELEKFADSEVKTAGYTDFDDFLKYAKAK